MAAEQIRADIVGTVLEVAVAAGERVAAGQSVLTIESMKMEIPVPAAEGGIVTSVEVDAGQGVREGDLLAVIVSSEV